MRALLTRLTVLAGVAFAVTSFALGLRLPIPGVPQLAATPAGLPAEIPYLPAFFILGIMLMFLSAVVYELLPGNRNASPPVRPRPR
ncbi:MAG: hypothetical protein QN152_09940 [Armatimonadota bacterium]|nr:hypothetical protein [Armatimonadota bacterium]MDR7539831.1 hypothetical protein [Armatimonadota bacterium]